MLKLELIKITNDWFFSMVLCHAGTKKFLTTQHEHDPLTTLATRGARFYESDIANFLSVDPLAADYASWSPYNYVMGNPVSLVDPDGRGPKEPETETGKTFIYHSFEYDENSTLGTDYIHTTQTVTTTHKDNNGVTIKETKRTTVNQVKIDKDGVATVTSQYQFTTTMNNTVDGVKTKVSDAKYTDNPTVSNLVGDTRSYVKEVSAQKKSNGGLSPIQKIASSREQTSENVQTNATIISGMTLSAGVYLAYTGVGAPLSVVPFSVSGATFVTSIAAPYIIGETDASKIIIRHKK